MTTPGKKKPDLHVLITAQKAKLTPALPPHDPNAPASTAAPHPKLPKGFVDGITGAALGHAADSLLIGGLNSQKAGGMGLGSLMLGGFTKLLASTVKDTNPDLAETLNAVGTGALMSAAAKAAANFKPEPLVEEAQKAVKEAGFVVSTYSIDPPNLTGSASDSNAGVIVEPLVEEAQKARSGFACTCTCSACRGDMHLACNFQCDDTRFKGDATLPLVAEAQLAVTDIKVGTEAQLIAPEPLVEEANTAIKEIEQSP